MGVVNRPSQKERLKEHYRQAKSFFAKMPLHYRQELQESFNRLLTLEREWLVTDTDKPLTQRQINALYKVIEDLKDRTYKLRNRIK